MEAPEPQTWTCRVFIFHCLKQKCGGSFLLVSLEVPGSLPRPAGALSRPGSGPVGWGPVRGKRLGGRHCAEVRNSAARALS